MLRCCRPPLRSEKGGRRVYTGRKRKPVRPHSGRQTAGGRPIPSAIVAAVVIRLFGGDHRRRSRERFMAPRVPPLHGSPLAGRRFIVSHSSFLASPFVSRPPSLSLSLAASATSVFFFLSLAAEGLGTRVAGAPRGEVTAAKTHRSRLSQTLSIDCTKTSSPTTPTPLLRICVAACISLGECTESPGNRSGAPTGLGV